MIDVLTVVLVLGGCFFFLAGTVGMLRFPDVYTRLHALTKADNLGLGLVAVGLVLQAEQWSSVFKVLAVWLLALAASASAAHLLSRAALESGLPPWRRR